MRPIVWMLYGYVVGMIASSTICSHGVFMAASPNRAWKDQYMLRLPDGMRDRIAELAKASGRSMNAEIVARLERSLETDEETENALADHEKRIEQLERWVDDLRLSAHHYDPDPD